jgi:hypothetical protein
LRGAEQLEDAEVVGRSSSRQRPALPRLAGVVPPPPPPFLRARAPATDLDPVGAGGGGG